MEFKKPVMEIICFDQNDVVANSTVEPCTSDCMNLTCTNICVSNECTSGITCNADSCFYL